MAQGCILNELVKLVTIRKPFVKWPMLSGFAISRMWAAMPHTSMLLSFVTFIVIRSIRSGRSTMKYFGQPLIKFWYRNSKILLTFPSLCIIFASAHMCKCSAVQIDNIDIYMQLIFYMFIHFLLKKDKGERDKWYR